MNLDPIKNQIMRLFESECTLEKKLATEKFEVFKFLLKEFSEWEADGEVFKRIIKFSKKNNILEKLRKEIFISKCFENILGPLITENEVNFIIQKEGGFLFKGTLYIPEKALEKLQKEQFWKFIEEHGVVKLVIERENEMPIIYKGMLLYQLRYTQTNLEDLTEEVTLTLESGETIELSKAKLLQCGKYFENLFQSGMKEATAQAIEIGTEDDSLSGLPEILSVIETGICPNTPKYIAAADQLQFCSQSFRPIPTEHLYGLADWEKHWGKVGTVPLLPKEAFEPCPVHNKEKKGDGPRMIDSFTFIWMPPTVDGAQLDVDNIERIAQSDKFGEYKTKYYNIYPPIRKDKEINKKVEKGYWGAFLLLEETRGFKDQQRVDYINNNFPKEFGLPTTRDMITYCLMPYARSGSCVLMTYEGENPSTYAHCEEAFGGGHMFVGVDTFNLSIQQSALAHYGLCVTSNSSDCVDPHICVVLARKFYGP